MLFLTIAFIFAMITLYFVFKAIRHEREIRRQELLFKRRIENSHDRLQKWYIEMKTEIYQTQNMVS